MPQIENVAQIIIGTLEGGHPNGVKHERKTSGNLRKKGSVTGRRRVSVRKRIGFTRHPVF
jgi:hypothetical protein